jgi:general nucleoside transport system ATP-binding protein
MSLDVRQVTKRFGQVVANDQVSLLVEPGSLHAVLGENGAGKSTLMKILSGYQPADHGEVRLDGSPIRLGSPRAAVDAGIGMLHQDPLVCLPFSVLDNFVLGRGGLDRRRARADLEEGAGRLGFRLDPEREARSLSVGERQQLEIVRLLSLGIRVLILDEPTSGISTGQRQALFEALRLLAGEGLIVLFVSHKLEEVEELCARVSVMRSGRMVGERALPCATEDLVGLMFGKQVAVETARRGPTGATVLAVRDLDSHAGRRRVEQATLDIAAGEVVGLAGLAGSGQRALLRAVSGLDRPQAGRVELAGVDVTGLPYRRLRAQGLHYLPAGRLEEGLFPSLTVTEHVRLSRPGGGVIDWEAAAADARAAIERYHVVGTPDTPVDDLSGGNQQRVLLAMMPDDVRLLLLEEPTRGLDIESANDVWRLLLERAERGTGIVVSSADLDELVRYCHRIAVFFDGRILEVVEAASVDPLRLGALIGGRRTA